MIAFEQAKNIALDQLEPHQPNLARFAQGDNLILEKVVEFDEGWLFIFNSQKYVETSNILDRPLGLGPIIVGKENGIVFEIGSGFTIDESINDFRKHINQWC